MSEPSAAEELHHAPVAVLLRTRQSRVAPLVLQRLVCARVQQRPHDVNLPFVGSNVERCEAIIICPVHVRSANDKLLHHLEVAALRSCRQWRDPVVLRLVHARARAHQRPHHLEVAVLRRDVERRATVVLRLVHARARAHQRPHHLEVADLRRDEERRGTTVLRLVHARARAHQRPHHLEVAILRRDKERRGTIVPRLVHARGRAPQKGFIEHCTPHTRPWRTRRNLRNPRQGRWPRRTNRKRTRPRACSGC
mmetsp:Transcript_56389/g.155711  ORF Transcript_56389/g.155711 Transcript_56389/m.155711 type:complete len:252 (+) Transcript_56389:232-987(+)